MFTSFRIAQLRLSPFPHSPVAWLYRLPVAIPLEKFEGCVLLGYIAYAPGAARFFGTTSQGDGNNLIVFDRTAEPSSLMVILSHESAALFAPPNILRNRTVKHFTFRKNLPLLLWIKFTPCTPTSRNVWKIVNFYSLNWLIRNVQRWQPTSRVSRNTYSWFDQRKREVEISYHSVAQCVLFRLSESRLPRSSEQCVRARSWHAGGQYQQTEPNPRVLFRFLCFFSLILCRRGVQSLESKAHPLAWDWEKREVGVSAAQA